MPPPTYVLIDFENVQPKNLEPLRETNHLIKIFLGHAQSRLATDFVKVLLPFGSRVELIEVDGNDSNALDFHIAYYIGRLACEAPGAAIQIISMDTGFDPLIRYLRKQNINCTRVNGVPGAAKKTTAKGSLVSADTLPPLSEQVDKVKANLLKRPAGRPRTMKTLRSTINALFQKKLTPAGLDELVSALARSGVASEVGGKIKYQ